MTGASDERAGDRRAAEGSDRPADEAGPDERSGEAGANANPNGIAGPDPEDVAALRERVEEEYDFDDFGPADMARMTPEEWDAAFDESTWITGERLLRRVEAELQSRIAAREVFAVLEYARVDGERCLVAYSDTDYAIVYPDGSVEGRGTVVRDVKPTVALCSMDEYEVTEPPEDWRLPAPEAVPESGSELGNWMLQLLGASQILIGLAALAAWLFVGARANLVLLVAGLGLVVIGLVLFVLVANARLSERFRIREYRDRLRSIGTAAESRPDFLPIDDEDFERSAAGYSVFEDDRTE